MIVRDIRRGNTRVTRVYHRGEIIYRRDPVVFHEIETFETPDDTLIIMGALNVVDTPDGLYIDCTPAWTYPVQTGNVLRLEQVYSASQNGNVLEVR